MKNCVKKTVSALLSFGMLASCFSMGASAAETQTSGASKTYLYGDVNLNGQVDILDATELQLYIAGAAEFNDIQKKAANVDENAGIDIRDVTEIQLYIAGAFEAFYPGVSFTVEEENDWRTSTISYEIFVRSFCDSDGDGIGDFRGIASKASYLKDLNVGCVWLMPIHESPSYHGYDVTDYYSTNEDYGTIEDFKYMLNVLHENGIKVIIDFVANHSSADNEWFQDAISNPDSPYKDYYFISDEKGSGSGWQYNSTYKKYYLGIFSSNMPDLNYNNKAVWREMEDAAAYWLHIGVDGFRLDASKHIDDDMNVTHAWWQDFEAKVKEINPDAFVVGENWSSGTSDIAPFFADMDSSFDFPLQSKLMNAANGNAEDLISFVNSALSQYNAAASTTSDIPKTTVMSTFLNNHDQTRTVSTLGSVEKAKLAAAIQMTLPGMPFIYYGEELGQKSNGNDPNRREPMDWYASASGAGMCRMDASFWGVSEQFTKANDGISLEEEAEDENSIYRYYKKLTDLRTAYPIFFTGTYNPLSVSGKLLSYTVTARNFDYGMYVAHNISDTSVTYKALCGFTDILSGKEYSAGDTVTLEARSSVILKYNGADKEFTPFDEPRPSKYNLTFQVTLPENTPEDAVYLAGPFADSNWDPKNPDYILERTSQTTAVITKTVTGMPGDTFEFKFTRGSWNKCECDANGGNNINGDGNQNHVYTFTEDTNPIVEVTVAGWLGL